MEECATLTNKAEQKKTEQDAVIAVNEELKKQVESLQSDLVASKFSRLDTELFIKEALSANERGLMIRRSFYDLMGSVQEMHQNLLLNEKMLNQQREELLSIAEIWRKVSEYQKQRKADQVKRFSFMELKRFQVILNSGENLMDEAQGIISEAKRDCDRIWESSYVVMSETGLPRIQKSEVIMPSDSKLETMEKEHQDKEMFVQQLK